LVGCSRRGVAGSAGEYRRDLDAIPPTDKTRREFVAWKIRFAEKRMADVCARRVKVVDRESDQT
jgi:hypothetical protein